MKQADDGESLGDMNGYSPSARPEVVTVVE